MTGRTFPAARTTVSTAEFQAALLSCLPESTKAMRAVLTAQCMLETGRFNAVYNYNLAGIKSGKDRDHTYFATTEKLPLSQALMEQSRSTPEAPCKIIKVEGDRAKVLYQPSHPTCRFRAYDTLEAGMQDYVTILRSRWAKAWSAAEGGDPDLFVKRLKQANYFTADEEVYARAVRSLFNEAMRAG